MIVLKNEIVGLIQTNKMIIRPLLEDTQIGEITIDLRLGYDFLVSILGRESSILTSYDSDNKALPVSSFFRETRRRLGETFLLYPHQTVLTTSLEYIKLPNNIFAILNMRSSYSRLGLTISTILQPGYCGCIPLELTNNNQNAINLTVGARIFQIRLVKISSDSNYFFSERKYICQVRPEVSSVKNDKDLSILNKIKNQV